MPQRAEGNAVQETEKQQAEREEESQEGRCYQSPGKGTGGGAARPAC